MFDLIVLLTLLAIGYGFGSWNERRHFRSIIEREHQLADIANRAENVGDRVLLLIAR